MTCHDRARVHAILDCCAGFMFKGVPCDACHIIMLCSVCVCVCRDVVVDADDDNAHCALVMWKNEVRPAKCALA